MGKGGSGFEKKEDAAMPKDAPLDGGAVPEQPSPDVSVGGLRKVSKMQAKLHRWAVADPGRRFDDLFNFVCDPATLLAAFGRVAGNQGARTPGIDGLTVADVEEIMGVQGFLDDLRADLKTGLFRPLPVRERLIPKLGGSERFGDSGFP
jgi:RNA-directed DNA polymerase